MTEKLLSFLYGDISSGVSLGSASEIYKKAIKIDPGIQKADVVNFLREKASYRLFSKKKNKFQRRKIYSFGPGKNLSIDLLEFSDLQKKQNRPYNFLYCSIDIFSGHLFGFPMKNKTSNELLLALDKSFHDLGRPKTLLTDMEPGLYSKVVTDFLKAKNVSLKSQESSVTLKIKNGQAESGIRFLRRIIARYCEEHKITRFVDYLTQIIEIFNQHKNRRTKFSPNQLRFDLNAIASYQEQLETELKDSVQKIDESKILPIGSYVNIQELPKNVFSKETEKRFSREPYLIVSVKRSFPIVYGLFPSPPRQNRKFYRSELFILPSDYAQKHSLPLPIQKILSKRQLRSRVVYECVLIGSGKHVFLPSNDIKQRFILFRNKFSEEILNSE